MAILKHTRNTLTSFFVWSRAMQLLMRLIALRALVCSRDSSVPIIDFGKRKGNLNREKKKKQQKQTQEFAGKCIARMNFNFKVISVCLLAPSANPSRLRETTDTIRQTHLI